MTQQYCYIHVRGQMPGNRIGMAKYLDSGYYPTGLDIYANAADEVDAHVDAINLTLGVSNEVRMAMEAGSMFGWRVPAAIPALRYFGAPEIDPEDEAKLVTAPLGELGEESDA